MTFPLLPSKHLPFIKHILKHLFQTKIPKFIIQYILKIENQWHWGSIILPITDIYYPLRKYHYFVFICYQSFLWHVLPLSNSEYHILEHDSICSPFFLRHDLASVLHPNASVSTQSKMDQFSCFSAFLLHHVPSPHPNIPPFRVVCHSNKSLEGGFRQCAVTHVTTGAKSELSGQRDANKLEIYAGGFIVAYFIWGNAGPVLMSVLHLWTAMSCREAHVDSAVYCQCNDKQYEQGIEWENPFNL